MNYNVTLTERLYGPQCNLFFKQNDTQLVPDSEPNPDSNLSRTQTRPNQDKAPDHRQSQTWTHVVPVT